MVEKVGGPSGIIFTATCDPVDSLIDKDAQLIVYRIVQECTNNIVKHSHARNAGILITRSDGAIAIAIHDDGAGFDTSNALSRARGGFGLSGLEERVRLLKGTLHIDSSPETGTTISIRIPQQQGSRE